LVGGEIKLLIEKDIVEPPLKDEETMFDKVTRADNPLHCRAEFTFCINL
jgi:hypothetical protein